MCYKICGLFILADGFYIYHQQKCGYISLCLLQRYNKNHLQFNKKQLEFIKDILSPINSNKLQMFFSKYLTYSTYLDMVVSYTNMLILVFLFRGKSRKKLYKSEILLYICFEYH